MWLEGVGVSVISMWPVLAEETLERGVGCC